MITKKRFSSVDGVTSRFLSDFIIQSEQFVRVYNYFYNPAGIEGEIDPGTGLPTRIADFPNPAEDLINLDKWDLVDNSILFYTEPVVGSSIYLEVATTPEEFGDTLTAPAVERAEVAATAAEASAAAALVSETNAALSETNAALSETNAGLSEAAAALSETNAGLSAASASADAAQTALDRIATNADAAQTALDRIATNADATTSGINATNAQLSEWEAEAERLTADSYATEAEDTFVNLVTSDGDGTFTYTPTTEYSALHWAAKASVGDIAPIIHAAPSKTTPIDADELIIADSASSFSLKKLTWANLKATLKTYFDTLYTGSSLLAEFEVTGAAVTSIDFSGLDINTHKSYRVEVSIKNATASSFDLAMFINGDTTPSNYYTQQLNATDTVFDALRVNLNQAIAIPASQSATSVVFLARDESGIARFSGAQTYNTGSSSAYVTLSGVKVATVTNITQLTFVSSVASALDVGSKIRIYRGDV